MGISVDISLECRECHSPAPFVQTPVLSGVMLVERPADPCPFQDVAGVGLQVTRDSPRRAARLAKAIITIGCRLSGTDRCGTWSPPPLYLFIGQDHPYMM
jgi:hypothetical protein